MSNIVTIASNFVTIASNIVTITSNIVTIASNIVIVPSNFQTIIKISLAVMQVIIIYLIDISIRKEKLRQNDASFLSHSVPSLPSMQFVSDFF